MKLYLYITKRKTCGVSTNIDDIHEIFDFLDMIFEQVQYEKYKYTYRMLKSEWSLLEISDIYDYVPLNQIKKLKEDIMEIKETTSKGNANISNIAERLMNEYSSLFSKLA